MERSLRTPIQCTIPAYSYRTKRPYLRLDSELDATGRSVDHMLCVTYPPGTGTGDSLDETVVSYVERLVTVPQRMLWQPRIVRLAMTPDIDCGEPNREVLRAFGAIRGAQHDIDLLSMNYNETEDAYFAVITRGTIAVETQDDYNESTRFRVTRAALAAAGLRLAAATTIIDATPLNGPAWQDRT